MWKYLLACLAIGNAVLVIAGEVDDHLAACREGRMRNRLAELERQAHGEVTVDGETSPVDP